MVEKMFGGRTLELVQGDITTQQVDALVNAANEGLRGGGGVDGAIHRAGGPSIMQECRAIGHCPTGQAVITTAGALPARYVIHTVGPVWHGGAQNEAALLESCYRESFRLAEGNGLSSVGSASISTGVYGYPLEAAAPIALNEAARFLGHEAKSVRLIRFVLFNASIFSVYQDVLLSM